MYLEIEQHTPKQQWVKKKSKGKSKNILRELLGSRGHGLIPGSGTKIPQVTRCSQKYVFILEQTNKKWQNNIPKLRRCRENCL